MNGCLSQLMIKRKNGEGREGRRAREGEVRIA